MATIKAYTDISQSKKLAEILSPESADICYVCGFIILVSPTKYGDTSIEELYKKHIIPAWSLAALLCVLPNENMLVKTTDGEYYCLAKDVMTKHYDNTIDACYELILKLHELKML